jgi:flagellar M-ring protein FliF
MMHWIELLVMALLGLVVMMMVVRPLVRRILAPEEPKPAEEVIAAALAGGDVQGAIAAGATADDIKGIPSQASKMIDIAQVQGQVHAQSVQRVGELAEKNPNETVSIIRTWLHETAA